MKKIEMERMLERIEYVMNKRKEIAEPIIKKFEGSSGTKLPYYEGQMVVVNEIMKILKE